MQHERDAELYERLTDARGHHDANEELAIILITYAQGAMINAVNQGWIVQECRRINRPVTAARLRHLHRDQHATRELVMDAVAEAWAPFCQGAGTDRGWRPDGGRSVRAYFLGACVLRFYELFRKWERQHGHDRRTVSLDDERVGIPEPRSSDPAGHVASAVFTQQALAAMPERIRQIVSLRMQDLTDREIAERLGTTPGAVQAAVHRFRRDNPGAGRDDER